MLSQQQSVLLKAIFSGENLHNMPSENKGLEIYQRSLIANAARALSITFATIHSYLGKKTFDVIVEEYLKTELKQEYDWGEFGQTFPQFIERQGINNAYLLSQLAQLDFICHKSERSQDVEVDLSTLNLLSEYDAYELYMTFCSGIALMQSSIPLDEVNNTITELTQEQKINQLDDVTQQLTEFSTKYKNGNTQNSTPYCFVIWRPDFQAQYTRITAEEYQWIHILLDKSRKQKASIGQALDEIQDTEFSLIEWLPKAIKEQLINGIYINSLIS